MATCATYHCPPGYLLKPNYLSILCVDPTECTIDECCTGRLKACTDSSVLCHSLAAAKCPSFPIAFTPGINICDGNSILTAMSGELYGVRQYKWSTVCEHIIEAPPGSVIVMSFFDIFLELSDFLEVYDGPSCSTYSPMLHLDGPQTPFPFGMLSHSNGVCIRVRAVGISSLFINAYVFRMTWSFLGFSL